MSGPSHTAQFKPTYLCFVVYDLFRPTNRLQVCKLGSPPRFIGFLLLLGLLLLALLDLKPPLLLSIWRTLTQRA